MYELDFDIFKNARSVRYTWNDGAGGHCAGGKMLLACGFIPKTIENFGEEHTWDRSDEAHNFFAKLREAAGYDLGYFGNQSKNFERINNEGRFKEADYIVLSSALNAGLVKFKEESMQEDYEKHFATSQV